MTRTEPSGERPRPPVGSGGIGSFYADRVHGAFYPPSTARPVPSRYRWIADRARRYTDGRSARVLEIGPEVPQTAAAWVRAIGVPLERASFVDVSGPAVSLLRAAGLRVDEVDISTDTLPYEDASFDLVVASEVLEHLLDADHALREIRRVLRADGGLVLTTPNLASWANRVQLALGYQPLGTETGREWVFGRGPHVPPARPVGHLQLFTRRGLDALLRFHRLRPVGWVGLPYSEEIPAARRIRWIDRWFARFPALASDLLVVAEPEESASR